MKRAKSKPKQLTNLASLDRTPIGRCQTSATADGNSERRTGAAAIASVPPNSRSVKAKPPAAVAHLASFFARASKNSLYYHTDGFLPGVTSFDNAEQHSISGYLNLPSKYDKSFSALSMAFPHEGFEDNFIFSISSSI